MRDNKNGQEDLKEKNILFWQSVSKWMSEK